MGYSERAEIGAPIRLMVEVGIQGDQQGLGLSNLLN